MAKQCGLTSHQDEHQGILVREKKKILWSFFNILHDVPPKGKSAFKTTLKALICSCRRARSREALSGAHTRTRWGKDPPTSPRVEPPVS
jgi:hypothetical protein